MSRPTPFGLTLRELADEQFLAIRVEAEHRNQDVTDRGQFASLPTVQRLLSVMEAPELIQSSPEAAAEYLSFLYAGYRFWAAGEPVVILDRATLVERLSDVSTRTTIDAPLVSEAVYVQFPERTIWSQIEADAPHEPIDGLFVVAGPQAREFTVVAVLGLREDRGGFSQITAVATPAEFVAARREARPDPFAPALEGGERMGFKSVTRPAELLLLASLATLVEPQ